MAVNVIFKSELDIIFQYSLKYLIGSFLVNSFPVGYEFNVFFRLFIIYYISLLSGSLGRDYNADWFFDSALIEKHVTRLSVAAASKPTETSLVTNLRFVTKTLLFKIGELVIFNN